MFAFTASCRRSAQWAVLNCLGSTNVLPLLALWVSLPVQAADTPAPSEARQLVAAAVQAEVAGVPSQYSSLLQLASRSAPDNKLAHWLLGQVQISGKWISVEEAERRAAHDPLLSDYHERRMAAAATPKEQLRLACWCRDHGLYDEAQLHWSIVLSLDPNNKEARRSSDVHWLDGQYVSRTQAAEQKSRIQAMKEATKYWEPIVARWRRAVSGRDLPAHDAALAEIRANKRLDVIPTLEAVTLGRDAHQSMHTEECVQITIAFLDALARLPEQAATESIVRHAVLAPGDKPRSLAIAELKKRDQHNYVPMLLAGLTMPIESSYQISTAPDGAVFYHHSLYREAADSDWAWDASYSMMRHPGSVIDIDDYDRLLGIDRAATVKRSQDVPSPTSIRTAYAGSATKIEAEVEAMDNKIARINAQIMPVLAATTDKDFATAKQWWEWWDDANEYYKSEHPVIREGDSQSNGSDYLIRRCSCFAKGTAVLTKTGRVPIESIEAGEFVLSQDVNTGELTYKPVITTTHWPGRKMLTLSLEREKITATPGHAFWVAGSGWRMSKELGDDARLHGVNSCSRVQSVAPATDADAYNLVVADFNTYFVGQAGILVHDVTPRQPTISAVPGVSKQ